MMKLLTFIKSNKLSLILITVLYYLYKRQKKYIKNTTNALFQPLITWASIYCGGGQLSLANMAVIVDDNVVFSTSIGKLDVTKSENATESTIFRMFSMTKPVTSVVAMILCERNLLRLDDNVEDYIPEFKDLQVYVSGDSLSNLVTKPAETKMKIRHLLSHQAGLSYGNDTPLPVDKLYKEEFKRGLFGYPLDEFVKKIGNLPLLFNPGTHFTYSVSLDILGFVIQVITMKQYSLSFREFMKREILDKLDMKDTDFFVKPYNTERLASLYTTSEKQGFGLTKAPSLFSEFGKGKLPSMISGGAGLFSTVLDYSKFLKIFTNNGVSEGKRVLSVRSVELLTKYNELGEHYCEITKQKINTDVTKKHFDQETFKTYRYYHGEGFNLMGSILVDRKRGFGTAFSEIGEFGWTGLGGLCFRICHIPYKENGVVKTVGVGLLFMSQTMPDKALPILPQFRWCGMKCTREYLNSIGYNLI